MDDVDLTMLRDAEHPHTTLVRRLLQRSFALEDRLRSTGHLVSARRGHYAGRVSNIVFEFDEASGIGPEDAQPRKIKRCRSNPYRWYQ